jgi:hypothetical protein
MSHWTHIVATLDVDTWKLERDSIKEYVEKLLEEAPRITGSEGDAEVIVNIKEGHNFYTSQDCKKCKFYETLTETGCDSPDDFKCPDGEYQSRVVITVVGDLRDRFPEQTKKEYQAFKKYVSKALDFEIRNSAVKIIG